MESNKIKDAHWRAALLSKASVRARFAKKIAVIAYKCIAKGLIND